MTLFSRFILNIKVYQVQTLKWFCTSFIKTMKTACETEVRMRRTKESFLQLLEVIEDEAAAKFESHKSYWVMLPPYVYVYLFPYFYGILLVQDLQPPKPLDFMNYNCMS